MPSVETVEPIEGQLDTTLTDRERRLLKKALRGITASNTSSREVAAMGTLISCLLEPTSSVLSFEKYAASFASPAGGQQEDAARVRAWNRACEGDVAQLLSWLKTAMEQEGS